MTGALLFINSEIIAGFKPMNGRTAGRTTIMPDQPRLSRRHSQPCRRGIRARRAALRRLPSDAFAVALSPACPRVDRGGRRAIASRAGAKACVCFRARKVLIAGSCDTGVLALTARAGAGHDLAITVLDACATPLELCSAICRRLVAADRHHAGRSAGPRRRRRVRSRAGAWHAAFRAARAPAGCRRAIGARARPGGRLVLLYNTSPRLAGELSRESREGYSGMVMDELARLGIPLPESVDAFRARLDAHAEEPRAARRRLRRPEPRARAVECSRACDRARNRDRAAIGAAISAVHQPDGQATFPRRFTDFVESAHETIAVGNRPR